MKKKGQAVMEFIFTYDWAILAAIIVIGVFVVFFRPPVEVELQICTASVDSYGLVCDEINTIMPLYNSTQEDIVRFIEDCPSAQLKAMTWCVGEKLILLQKGNTLGVVE